MTKPIQERRLDKMDAFHRKLTYIGYLEKIRGNVTYKHVPDIWIQWLAAIREKYHRVEEAERLGEVA